jgi:hypothetical protein
VELGDVVLQIHFYRIISEKIVRSLDASQLMGVSFIGQKNAVRRKER